MRELFIYYRVRVTDASVLKAAVNDMQARLRADHPGLAARVLRRYATAHDDGALLAGDTPPQETTDTWMEVYGCDPGAAPEGFSSAIERAIDAAALPLLSLIDGPRCAEVFESS